MDSPASAPFSPASTLGCPRARRCRLRSDLRSLRYTLCVMPAVTTIGTILHRPSRGSVGHFLCRETGSGVLIGRDGILWAKYATAVWGFMLYPFNLLIATGVPAGSRLRPVADPGNGLYRMHGPRPTWGRRRRCRLSKASSQWIARPGGPSLVGPLSDFRAAGIALRLPPWLTGGFAQLGSI